MRFFTSISNFIYPILLNPLKHWGALYAPPSLAFCLLLKISWGNPYLKILYLGNLFVVDTHMKKKSKNLVLTPSQSTLKNGSDRPCLRGLRKKIYLDTWTRIEEIYIYMCTYVELESRDLINIIYNCYNVDIIDI